MFNLVQNLVLSWGKLNVVVLAELEHHVIRIISTTHTDWFVLELTGNIYEHDKHVV